MSFALEHGSVPFVDGEPFPWALHPSVTVEVDQTVQGLPVVVLRMYVDGPIAIRDKD